MRAFIASSSPSDPFPRYGLAQEYKNAGRLDEARATFDALMSAHPDYTAAYLHAGNALLALGAARRRARRLRSAASRPASRRGDAHARGELEGALASL